MPVLSTGDADKKKAGDWFVIKIVVFAKAVHTIDNRENAHKLKLLYVSQTENTIYFFPNFLLPTDLY